MAAQQPLVACWLDQNIGEAGTHLALKRRFENISKRIIKWNYFDSGDQFNEFIDANPNVKLVAIISGRLAKCLVTPVADRETLHSVYVFCGNKTKYQALASDEPKIRGVFDSEDDLFNRMQSDLQKEFP